MEALQASLDSGRRRGPVIEHDTRGQPLQLAVRHDPAHLHLVCLRSLARGVHYGVRVSAFCPGVIRTPLLIDAGRTSRTEVDGLQQLGHYANLAARFAEYCVAHDDQVGLIAFADRPLATLKPVTAPCIVLNGLQAEVVPYYMQEGYDYFSQKKELPRA